MVPENILSQDLVDLSDSLLILVDVQELFVVKLPEEERRLLMNRIGWILQVAGRLNVPAIATVEDSASTGSLLPDVARLLPAGTPVFDKLAFDLSADASILAGIVRRGRKTLVLAGLETDVCVAQSALGLLRLGYKVVALADATGSPAPGHQVGLERMRRAGILISAIKSVYYEWMRTVEKDNQFRRQWPELFKLPEGVTL